MTSMQQISPAVLVYCYIHYSACLFVCVVVLTLSNSIKGLNEGFDSSSGLWVGISTGVCGCGRDHWDAAPVMAVIGVRHFHLITLGPNRQNEQSCCVGTIQHIHLKKTDETAWAFVHWRLDSQNPQLAILDITCWLEWMFVKRVEHWQAQVITVITEVWTEELSICDDHLHIVCWSDINLSIPVIKALSTQWPWWTLDFRLQSERYGVWLSVMDEKWMTRKKLLPCTLHPTPLQRV